MEQITTVVQGSSSPFCYPLTPKSDLLASNFSLQYHPLVMQKGHENKENYQQPKKLLM